MVNPAIQDKRRYWQARPGAGFSWATCETRADAEQYVGADDPTVTDYEIREKWMTPNQFNNLPEHDGW